MTVKAVIYARFSPRPDADDSQSNAKQIERCRQWAAEKGYEVAEDRIFADEALTGADDEKHPDPLMALSKRKGIVAALKATTKGMVLLVRWRSRIARDPYVQQAVERIVGGQGGRVEATDESNETGLAGELTRGVLATVAKYEVIKIRLMTALAMQKYQKDGRRMTRSDRCPFGWRSDPEEPTRLIEDGDEQDTIRKIMEWHRQGMNANRICTELDRAGIRRRGKLWRKNRNMVVSIVERELEKVLPAVSPEATSPLPPLPEPPPAPSPPPPDSAREPEAAREAEVDAAEQFEPVAEPIAQEVGEAIPPPPDPLDFTQKRSWGFADLCPPPASQPGETGNEVSQS